MVSKIDWNVLEQSRSEGAAHKRLKRRAVKILELAGAHSTVLEAKAPGIKGRVDVAGYWPSVTVAIECGKTPAGRIEGLRTHYDVVVHLPYCWTPKFFPDRVLARKIDDEIWRR